MTEVRVGRILSFTELELAVPSFDPAKDAKNLRDHGVSLAFGKKVVADPHAIEVIDDRFAYGEERWNVIGMIDGQVYVATYTDREEGVRFISVRPASKREADRYYGRT